MTKKNIEKLAAEGERLLLEELENRYKNLRNITGEFLEAKGKGRQNIPLESGTYLAYGPFAVPKSITIKDKYREALENFLFWTNRVNEFGLSPNPWVIDIESYKEELTD